jgi:hypothetical protein
MEELRCSDEIALKLKQMSSATIDRKLRRQKESQRIKGRHKRQLHPLLYQKIPIKVFPEQDRTVLGNIQIDLVEHCGSSAQGEFINTFSSTDISTGWWEGEAQMGRAQERSFESVSQTRSRYPCLWKEMHSDNDTTFINEQLFKYAEREGLGFSRSRPYKKDDNCLVEQKNWTHVKKFVGYLRYDTNEELDVLNSLYQNELRLYKNFFQPVIKLRLKERINGRIRRRYDKAKTPYQRMLESREITQEKKQELKTVYQSLNPAQLKRVIDWKLNLLYRVYQKKNKTLKVEPMKRLKPISASFLNLWPKIVSVR